MCMYIYICNIHICMYMYISNLYDLLSLHPALTMLKVPLSAADYV